MDDYSRTKVWLKTLGILQQDGLWYIGSNYVMRRLFTILEWELPRDRWALLRDGAVVVLLDWDGRLDGCEADIVRSEMDVLGQIRGYTGWKRFRHLNNADKVWIMFNLHEYDDMVA